MPSAKKTMLVAVQATDKQLIVPLHPMHIFHKQHFLIHEQTSWSCKILVTKHISECMAFAQSSFAHRTQI